MRSSTLTEMMVDPFLRIPWGLHRGPSWVIPSHPWYGFGTIACWKTLYGTLQISPRRGIPHCTFMLLCLYHFSLHCTPIYAWRCTECLTITRLTPCGILSDPLDSECYSWPRHRSGINWGFERLRLTDELSDHVYVGSELLCESWECSLNNKKM